MGEDDPGILITLQTNKMKNKETRRKEAIERQAEYDTLTPQQKILALDIRLGGGVGAVKQRAKLALKAAEPLKTTKPELVGESKKRKPTPNFASKAEERKWLHNQKRRT